MTAALIVIEIAAPNVSNDALAVLVSACSRAARDAECVLAKNATDQQSSAVAIVSLQAENSMRVEVGLRQGERDSWRTKDFSFLAADDRMERWRVIGFAIGTLAESNPPHEDTPPPPPEVKPPPAPSPPQVLPPPPKPKKKLGPKMFVGAAVISGPGLDSGPWRLGSTLYAGLDFPNVPVFFTVGGSAATRLDRDSSGATARWFEISTGAGVPLLGLAQNSGLELSTSIIAEYFDVSASTLGRSETKSRWTLGVQGGLGGRLQIVPDLQLTAEVLAAGLSGATEVRVAGAPIGNAASFRYLGSFGLRVRLR